MEGGGKKVERRVSKEKREEEGGVSRKGRGRGKREIS